MIHTPDKGALWNTFKKKVPGVDVIIETHSWTQYFNILFTMETKHLVYEYFYHTFICLMKYLLQSTKRCSNHSQTYSSIKNHDTQYTNTYCTDTHTSMSWALRSPWRCCPRTTAGEWPLRRRLGRPGTTRPPRRRRLVPGAPRRHLLRQRMRVCWSAEMKIFLVTI